MRMQLQYAQSATVPIYMAEVIGHDNDLFERQILERGDVQSRSTNVKGDMTEWMVREPEWYNLCADIIQNHIIFLSGEINVNWDVFAVWGANYKMGDYTIYHAHMPSIFSFCYYPKADRGASPLVFPDIFANDSIFSITPYERQLIIFPSYLKHGVPSQVAKGKRMVISGNIIARYD